MRCPSNKLPPTLSCTLRWSPGLRQARVGVREEEVWAKARGVRSAGLCLWLRHGCVQQHRSDSARCGCSYLSAIHTRRRLRKQGAERGLGRAQTACLRCAKVPCDARVPGPWPNSLRSLRSLRSNKRPQVRARSARVRARPGTLCFSAAPIRPAQAPPGALRASWVLLGTGAAPLHAGPRAVLCRGDCAQPPRGASSAGDPEQSEGQAVGAPAPYRPRARADKAEAGFEYPQRAASRCSSPRD